MVVEILILIGVAVIDGKLWKMMASQQKHQGKVESLLTEIRDGLRPTE